MENTFAPAEKKIEEIILELKSEKMQTMSHGDIESF